MAKFRFELDPVLRARQREEDVIQRDVARLQRQRTMLEDGLRNRQVRLSESKRSVRDQLVGTIETSNVRMQATASLAIMRDAERTVLELAGIHQRLEEARSRLREAAKRRRAIELLRERRVVEWRRNESRAEQLALDELAVIRAARTNQEEIL
jgi:flagellar export protein FliJ